MFNTVVLKDDGSVALFGSNKNGQCNLPNLANTRVTQVACGDYNVALLKEDGKVIIISDNHRECDMPDLGNKYVIQVSLGAYHSALLCNDYSVIIFGENDHGQCTIPNKLEEDV